MPDVNKLMEQLRDAIIAQQSAVMDRAGSSFAGVYSDLEPYMLALNEAAYPGISTKEFQNLAAYKLLMDELDKQLTKYQGYIEVEYDNAIRDMVEGGGADGEELLVAVLGVDAVSKLTPEQKAAMIERLKKEGHDFIDQLITDTKEKTKSSLLDALKLGGVAGLLLAFKDQLGAFLVSIIRFLNTAMGRAYKDSLHAGMLANSDVVTGWIWYAHLDGACLACAAMHGTRHGMDETLDDHPNGHCVEMPITILNPNPDIQTGEQWFNGLSEQEKQQMLGPGKYEKWINGELKFSDLVTIHTDEVYGTYIGVTPLKDL